MEIMKGYVSYARNQVIRFWSIQFIRFLIVGAVNTAFGYSVYLLCLWIGSPYQIAVVISTVLGTCFNFCTTGTVVFRNSALSKIFGFVVVYGVTLVINLALLTLLIGAGVSKALGQALVLPAVIISSFTLNKFLVFRTDR